MAEAMAADPAISTRQVAEQFGIHHSVAHGTEEVADLFFPLGLL